MVDRINRTRCVHVLTVEDPIEFLHKDHKSIINQREVATDTRSFAHAMRAALRQDPDVILVGEMRDFETVETALLAAETGHLVFSTLHTLDATETINRIIAVFPPHQQKQIRLQLASVLQGGHLAAPRAAGRRPGPRARPSKCWSPRRSSATASSTRRRPISSRRPSPPERPSTGCRRSTSRCSGCCGKNLITYDEALRWATNIDEFKLKVQGIATASDEAQEQMARGVVGGNEPPPEITRFSRKRGPCDAAPPPVPADPEDARKAAYGAAPAPARRPGDVDAPASASASARAGYPGGRDRRGVARLTRVGHPRRPPGGAGRPRSTLVAVRQRGRHRVGRELERLGFSPDQAQRRRASPSWPTPTSARSSPGSWRRSSEGRRSIPDPAAYRRLYAALLRRGFPADLIRTALRPYWGRRQRAGRTVASSAVGTGVH